MESWLRIVAVSIQVEGKLVPFQKPGGGNCGAQLSNDWDGRPERLINTHISEDSFRTGYIKIKDASSTSS